MDRRFPEPGDSLKMPEFPGGPDSRIVITGGPGSGKTTLIHALHELGYPVFSEIARDLIATGEKPPNHPENPAPRRFFETVLRERIRCHEAGRNQGIVFYDRGIPDSAAYFNYRELAQPDLLRDAIVQFRYYPVVFAASPWRTIYRQDAVRRESFEEAAALYGFAVNAYRAAGYDVQVLPEATVGERVTFILSLLGAAIGQQNDK